MLLRPNPKSAIRNPKCRQLGLVGVEPTTSPLSGVRSNQLSYKPVSISDFPLEIDNWKSEIALALWVVKQRCEPDRRRHPKHEKSHRRVGGLPARRQWAVRYPPPIPPEPTIRKAAGIVAVPFYPRQEPPASTNTILAFSRIKSTPSCRQPRMNP